MIKKVAQKAALSLMIGVSALSITGPSFANGLKVSYVSGQTVKETSNILDNFLFDEVENLFLASGDDYADALTGGVYMGEMNGSLFLVEDKKIEKKSYEKIAKAKNVYVIGGEARIPDSLVKDLKNYRGRIAGNNRYETAQQVANIVGSERNILITSGENFPDALAASALAIHKDYNIILTAKNSVPAATKEYLAKNKDKLVYFIGGEAAISNSVKREIFSIMGKNTNDVGKHIIAGKNRYETSKAAAEAFGNFDNAVIANGSDYQDALIGTSLAAQKTAPMLLTTSPTQAEDLSNYLSSKGLSEVYGVSTKDRFSVDHLGEIASKLSGSEVAIKDTNGKTIQVAKPGSTAKATPAPAPAPQPAPQKQVERPVETYTGWVVNTATVRTGADSSYKSVGTLPKGTKLVGPVINNYVSINYDGTARYVAIKELSKTEVNVTAAKETTVTASNGTTDAIVKGAQGFLGYPYVWASHNPSVGFDCSGLVYYLYRTHAGITLNRNSAAQASNGTAVSKSNLKPGDLLFFATSGGKTISHVGIYVGNGKMVHASSPSTGVRTDDINSSYYVNTYVTARRIIN